MKNRDMLSQQTTWQTSSILSKLRTFIVCALLSTTLFNGYAQIIELKVGPYKVRYQDEDEYRPYLSIDSAELYDFFNLKRDTIIYNNVIPTKLDRGIQITANTGISGLLSNGGFKHYDIDVEFKQQLNDAIYINAGLSAGISAGEYGKQKTPHYRKDQMIEVGVPVSLEVTNLYKDYDKASLYGSVGFIPTFYKTIKIDNSSADKVRNDNVQDFGILVTPRADFGVYIPVFGQAFRIGIYGEYRICCYQNVSIYKKRVSKSILGLNVGLVF